MPRTRSRRPATAPLDTAPEPAGREVTEDTALDATDRQWSDRLATLPSPMRHAVVLRHVIGLDYDEIAEAVDRPVGTVKSDVHRALERLRALLVAEGASS